MIDILGPLLIPRSRARPAALIVPVQIIMLQPKII